MWNNKMVSVVVSLLVFTACAGEPIIGTWELTELSIEGMDAPLSYSEDGVLVNIAGSLAIKSDFTGTMQLEESYFDGDETWGEIIAWNVEVYSTKTDEYLLEMDPSLDASLVGFSFSCQH